MSPDAPQLRIDPIDDLAVFRVGYRPDSWRWSPWTFSPFTGRWDDPLEQYRALYAGTSAFACYVEVLAQFRPDPAVVAGVAEIVDDLIDPHYPTLPAGMVPPNWFVPRLLGQGRLSGNYVDIQHAESIANLRPTFIAQALAAGLMDFDGAVVRASSVALSPGPSPGTSTRWSIQWLMGSPSTHATAIICAYTRFSNARAPAIPYWIARCS